MKSNIVFVELTTANVFGEMVVSPKNVAIRADLIVKIEEVDDDTNKRSIIYLSDGTTALVLGDLCSVLERVNTAISNAN